jgi:hypothetical protein
MASLAAVRPAHPHARRASCSPSKWSDFKLASSLHAARSGTDVFAERAELVLNCVVLREILNR